MIDYESIALHWTNRLGFLVRKELTQRFRAAGFDVTVEEWAILLILWKGRAQTPGEIADVTFRDRTTVTRLVDAMVRKGYVERSDDPADRRRSVLVVSHKGRALEQSLVPIARQLVEDAQTGIDPGEVSITVRTLRSMTENLVGLRERESGNADKKGGRK